MIARPQMEFAANIFVCFLNEVCSWFSHALCKPRRLKEISKKGGEGDVEPADGKDLMSTFSLSAFM